MSPCACCVPFAKALGSTGGYCNACVNMRLEDTEAPCVDCIDDKWRWPGFVFDEARFCTGCESRKDEE